MSLNKKLREIREKSISRRPEDIIAVMKNAAKKLDLKNIPQNAIKVGELFPEFELLNAYSEKVKLSDLLNSGNLVVTFYRGGW